MPTQLDNIPTQIYDQNSKLSEQQSKFEQQNTIGVGQRADTELSALDPAFRESLDDGDSKSEDGHPIEDEYDIEVNPSNWQSKRTIIPNIDSGSLKVSSTYNEHNEELLYSNTQSKPELGQQASHNSVNKKINIQKADIRFKKKKRCQNSRRLRAGQRQTVNQEEAEATLGQKQQSATSFAIHSGFALSQAYDQVLENVLKEA